MAAEHLQRGAAAETAALHLLQANGLQLVARNARSRAGELDLVMRDGSIVEMGSHEALLHQQGKYYELYMTQFAGFAT